MEQKKPRWEVKFEQYKQESAKYAKMRRDLKALKEGKVTGDFKTKEEYQNAVDARAKQIAEYEKEVKGYENFKKNGQKVQNILEYRNGLIEKLNNLPKIRNEEETKKLNDKKNEQVAKAQRIGQYQVEIDDLKQQLKNKDLSDNDKQILLLTLKARMDAMGILQEEQANLDREISSLEEIGKDFNQEIQMKKATYERKIAKCNIIAANLLKGKELGKFDIKVVPEDKNFKSNDNKLPEEVEKARQEQENDKQEQTVAQEKAEQENTTTTVADEFSYEVNFDEQTNSEATVENDFFANPEIVDDEIANQEENKAIAEVNDFATKHPILARMGNFFKNMGSRVSNLFKRKDKSEKVETVKEGEAEVETEKDEINDADFIEFLKSEEQEKVTEEKKVSDKENIEATTQELYDKDMEEFQNILNIIRQKQKERAETKKEEEKISLDEDEFLKAVAEKGEEEALKDRRKAFREKIAKEAANRYAEKYGGIYERQDGATAKKVETPKKEDNGR